MKAPLVLRNPAVLTPINITASSMLTEGGRLSRLGISGIRARTRPSPMIVAAGEQVLLQGQQSGAGALQTLGLVPKRRKNCEQLSV